jgi:hypothetical protein
VSEERVALERFDYGDDAIVATDPQVVALGDVVGQDNSRSLADSGEHREENAAFQRLGFVHDDK